MKLNNKGVGGVILIIVLIISMLIGGFTWPYTINTWLVYLGKQPSVMFWHGMLLGLCPGLGQLSIPLAVITWIASMFI